MNPKLEPHTSYAPTPYFVDYIELESTKEEPATKEHDKRTLIKIKAHKPRGKVDSREHRLISMYGLTNDDYDDILTAQAHKCAVCRRPAEESQRLHVDHDHRCCPSGGSCGKCIRGLLCSSCNRGLGCFKDSPELLDCAIDYLTAFKYKNNK